MPYKITKEGNKFLVINIDTGKVKGKCDSMIKAKKQMALLEGIEHGWKPTGTGKK